MSDEQPTPSLRLRPRATPVPATPSPAEPSEAPPVPVEPESTPEAPGQAAAANEPLRFRLKPKTPPPEGLPAETPVPFSTPPMPVDPVQAAAEEPSPAPAAEMPPVMEPEPVPQYVPPAAPPPQHISTPSTVLDDAAPLQVAPESSHAKAIKADKWLAAIVVLVIVLSGAIWGARLLFKANPKPKATANARAEAGEKPAASAPAQAETAPAKPLPGSQARLVEKPKSEAGQAIARARDVVVASDARIKAGNLDGEPDATAGAPAQNAPQPQNVLGPNTPPRTPVVEEVANQPTEPVVPPSEAFRLFVVNLRVNGVFQGENPRAMLNGRMYLVGAEVDVKLAITLHKIDPEAKQLIFRDDTGAILSRRY